MTGYCDKCGGENHLQLTKDGKAWDCEHCRLENQLTALQGKNRRYRNCLLAIGSATREPYIKSLVDDALESDLPDYTNQIK